MLAAAPFPLTESVLVALLPRAFAQIIGAHSYLLPTRVESGVSERGHSSWGRGTQDKSHLRCFPHPSPPWPPKLLGAPSASDRGLTLARFPNPLFFPPQLPSGSGNAARMVGGRHCGGVCMWGGAQQGGGESVPTRSGEKFLPCLQDSIWEFCWGVGGAGDCEGEGTGLAHSNHWLHPWHCRIS